MEKVAEIKRKNGTRYCPKCGSKLQKNGHDRRGLQRWLCTGRECGKTMRLKDDRQKKRQEVEMILEWILTKMTAAQACRQFGISRTTFWRKKKAFFKYMPELVSTGEVYDCVLVDGTYIKKTAFLIAKTPNFVIDSIFASAETVEAYQLLFTGFPAPAVITCDGHKSILSAVAKSFENTRIQRCFVHLLRYVKRNVSLHPTTPGRAKILQLTKKLFSIGLIEETQEKAKENAEKWNEEFLHWYKKYEKEINAKHEISPRPGAKGKRYQWDDRKLHFAWKHMKDAFDRKEIWTFLDYPRGMVVRDTNSLEGGVNSNLKQLSYVHRGMKQEDEQVMLKWDLVRKSEFGLDDYLRNLKITKTPPEKAVNSIQSET